MPDPLWRCLFATQENENVKEIIYSKFGKSFFYLHVVHVDCLNNIAAVAGMATLFYISAFEF